MVARRRPEAADCAVRGAPGDPRAGAGPGVLVAVVGAEGRGKDMLVSIAQRRFGGDSCLVFPRRFTTRAAAGVGADVTVSRRVFRDMADQGRFWCRWDADGQSYGLGREVADALAAGATAFVVVDRAALAALRSVWSDVRVVEIMAGADAARAFRRRVPGDLEVRHDGDVAAAAARFHDLIRRLDRERPATPSPVAAERPGRARPAGPAVPRRKRTGLRTAPQRA